MLAWRHRTIVKDENTGHIVIIDGLPVDEAGGMVRVAIIDATSLLHHAHSRAPNGSGVGRGTMWFVADPQGRPTGYRWSSRNSRLIRFPIAIGRATDPVAPTTKPAG